MATRFQGDADLVVMPKAPGSSLDPSAELSTAGTHLTTRLGFDLTKPLTTQGKDFEKALFPVVDISRYHKIKANMHLTSEENEMLAGGQGRAVQKAMQILVALGNIYGAERMIPVSSVQIAGVSYDNLGEAGLQFLSEMADGGGRVRVLTTLNPAGMDIENWPALGIPPDFAEKQMKVLEAFSCMGVTTTCTCTPYLIGNLPKFGDQLWPGLNLPPSATPIRSSGHTPTVREVHLH